MRSVNDKGVKKYKLFNSYKHNKCITKYTQ